MKKINSAFSHLNYANKKKSLSSSWRTFTSHQEIVCSDPVKVENYLELVSAVAQISFYNEDLFLFFRGQSKEYIENGNATIFPSIYRNDGINRDLKNEFDSLLDYENEVIHYIKNRVKATAGTDNLVSFRELRWAIIQHYNRHRTPTIDITHSLHVACSFALQNNKQCEKGILYLLGFPEFPKTIKFSTSEKLSIVRLMGFGIPVALRPYLQQAYSVSPFPQSDLDNIDKRNKFDFSRRLVAKFEIENTPNFWTDGFNEIPTPLLTPDSDTMDSKLPPSPIDVEAFWHYVSSDSKQ